LKDSSIKQRNLPRCLKNFNNMDDKDLYILKAN
jgi:hypothetical protein